MTGALRTLAIALFAVLACATADAHEVRPAMLDIRQTAADSYAIVWKKPIMGDVGIHLQPRLSNGWLDRAPQDQYAAGSYMIEQWRITRIGPHALDATQLRVEGLQGTITDVFVRATFIDGRQVEGVVRGQSPVFRFGDGQARRADRLRFLKLGMHHILTGPDHLLFVFGLLLLSNGVTALLKIVSGFTLAHSITLAIGTIWRLDLPLSLLDMLVALSILALAPEVIRAQQGGNSLTLRHPMIPAFGFGLIHGLGFASGLNPLDFDRSALFAALLQFNLGVEIGQLAFVGTVFGAYFVIRAITLQTHLHWLSMTRRFPAYFIGIAGATWLFQCGAAVLRGQ